MLGLIVNYFNPKGIKLIREKTKISWASDSLLNEINKDTIVHSSDSVKTDSMKSTLIEEKTNPAKNKIIVKEKPDSSKNLKTEKQLPQNEVIAFKEPKAIHLEQAYSLFNKGVTFVDARDESDYLAGHIKNAINIPFEDFDNYKQRLAKLPKDKPLVTYCAGTECDLSILLGNLLFEEGYKQVYVFFGGWIDWTNANYPVVLPEQVKKDE